MTTESKELKVFKKTNTSLYFVQFEGGGNTPTELSGMWTTPQLAQTAIDKYLAKKEAEKNAYVEERKKEIKEENKSKSKEVA